MNRSRFWGRPGLGLLALLLGAAAAVGAMRTGRAEAQAFAVRQMELSFDDGRPNVTVPRNYPGLRAYANVAFQGQGIFQAFWVVDGRVLGLVSQYVMVDQGLQLASPEEPALPTFEPGRHTVALQVRTPQSMVRVPVLTYYVTAVEYQASR